MSKAKNKAKKLQKRLEKQEEQQKAKLTNKQNLNSETEYQLKKQMKTLRLKLKGIFENRMKKKRQIESSFKMKKQKLLDLRLNLDCLRN